MINSIKLAVCKTFAAQIMYYIYNDLAELKGLSIPFTKPPSIQLVIKQKEAKIQVYILIFEFIYNIVVKYIIT